MKIIAKLILSLTLLTTSAGLCYAKEVLKTTFDDGKEGIIAPGFTCAKGNWIVKKEQTPSGKPNFFFAQTQALANPKDYSIAVFDKVGTVKDFAIQLRIRLVGKNKNQTAGFAFKYKNDSDFMHIALSGSENSVTLFKVSGRNVSILAKADAKIESGVWYRLQLSTKDDRLSCSLNGIKILQAKEKSLDTSGKVGFITIGDTLSDFDNFSFVPITK